MSALQTVIPCSRPDGSTVALPILGPRGRALIQSGWRIEARDDGNIYSLRLVHPSDDDVGYGAQGATWVVAWNQMEWTIASLSHKRS